MERREIAALWRWEGRHLSKEHQREIARRSAAALATWAKSLLARRPSLAAEDAELLCWAALSVFGSVSVHHTSTARKRFVALLVELATSVLDVTLPTGAPVTPPTADFGTPSRREQVLAAATGLFGRRGFHDVSMEDIGAAAGIAGPSVYRHFPSKAALMVAIGHRAADRLALAAQTAVRAANERDALRRLAASYVDTILHTRNCWSLSPRTGSRCRTATRRISCACNGITSRSGSRCSRRSSRTCHRGKGKSRCTRH